MNVILKYKDKIRLSLLTLFFLTLPNSVAINNIVLGLIIAYWLLLGDKKNTFKLIKINPFVSAVYIYFAVLFVSLLWTSDIKWGLHMLNKELILLFIPILMSLIQEKEKDFLIKIFIFSMTCSEILSYSIKLRLLPPMFNAIPYDPTPFMGHISYNPYLAFTIYLLIYFLFTTKESLMVKIISILFIFTMSINLFITGGRAGQAAFFVLIILAVFQFMKINIKSLFIVGIIVPIIFFTAYKTSRIFHDRVNLAVYNITNFHKNPNTSVGERIIFAKNTVRMIKEHPIFGVGIGDYKDEYKKINDKYFPNIPSTVQPHDMYLLVWAESGIFAFLSFILIFVIQLIIGIKLKDKYQPIRIAFPLFFLVIMFSDSYLLGHFTTHLFIAFSSILYKEATWKLIKF
jgi:O-antigen ligase